MKIILKYIRKILGFSIIIPFYIAVRAIAIFRGRDNAVETISPLVKNYIAFLAEMTIIPKVRDRYDFDRFLKKLQFNIKIMKPLYDIKICYQDENKIVLNYTNCPHCEAFFSLGLPELSRAACDSDWQIAEKNSDKWHFERNHQIGTGDTYCDHTYFRKI